MYSILINQSLIILILNDFINYCKHNSIDQIIYAVGKVGGILDNSQNQSNYLLYNTELALNLFKVAKETNLKKIITFGSSCMYPINAVQPFKENSLFSGVVEKTSIGYAMSKLILSQGGFLFNEENENCKFISVIPNSCFGPKDDFNPKTAHVLSSLIAKFHEAKTEQLENVSLFGTGIAKREFIYSDDVADAVFFLMENISDNRNLPINIGTGVEISILDLAKKIKKLSVLKEKLNLIKENQMELLRKILDSSYLNGLGWKYKYTIDEAINLTYNWYLENHDN